MTTHKTPILFFLALAVGVTPANAHRLKTATLTQESRDNFEIQKVAEGVYALIRKEPWACGSRRTTYSSINDDDVVVVDANISIAATKEVIAALRRLTPKPVRSVINTLARRPHRRQSCLA